MPRTARRPVPLTPLIDVIFLLLLFFMLTTTFTRTGEIPIASAGAGGQGLPPLFLRVGETALALNGEALEVDGLGERLRGQTGGPRLLVSMESGLRAQRLAEVLNALRRVPGVQVQVLGG